MELKQSIEGYLKAVTTKNLKELQRYLPKSGPMAGIMCDGTILDSVEDFLDFHEEWFADEAWSISHDIVMVEETDEMGYAVSEGDYFDKDDDGEAYSMSLVTTCVMRKIEGRWVVTLFQQTETNLDD